MIDVWNLFLWCGNEIQVLSQVFLKTSTSYAVTTEVTELNYRKYQRKDGVYFQPEDNHETKIAESENVLKKLQVQTWVENHFSFKFSTLKRGVWNVKEKRRGKQLYLETSRQDIEKPIQFWRIVLLTHWTHVYTLQLTRGALTQRSSPSFLSILAHFPNRNYKSRSTENNLNWCWHHTLHLKKKTFPTLENLLKTSGTMTKVLSCLKITVASMHFDRFTSRGT